MTTNLNLLKIFCKVSELGSFTKAAKALNMPKSRVSRAIASLELELGTQLIRRTTRQTSLTSAGEEFFISISPLLIRLDQEIQHISEATNEIKGVIRITAPEDMSQTILSDMISKYIEAYPKVEIQSIITNQYLDLAKENIDLALRVGTLKDSNLIQNKLTDVGLILVASNKYLKKYGCPNSLSELEGHRFLSFRDIHTIANSEFMLDSFKTVITSDSFSMLLRLALDGQGISILPDYYCKSYLESGMLTHILPKWKGKKSPVHIVYSPTKNLPQKVRKFIEIAKEISI
ncbi:LysR family transcriptional regulator [Halobacteriovorax sp. HLS]|uniref:LysR family transcriptional regulator n=1 Tax=Halobacteriovorax sp. HLS TaxID=2234000 RepID=UPI000FD9CCF9|nr:LysR family transcriptional regulator [Halobacteriovorax sp. HLS]